MDGRARERSTAVRAGGLSGSSDKDSEAVSSGEFVGRTVCCYPSGGGIRYQAVGGRKVWTHSRTAGGPGSEVDRYYYAERKIDNRRDERLFCKAGRGLHGPVAAGDNGVAEPGAGVRWQRQWHRAHRGGSRKALRRHLRIFEYGALASLGAPTGGDCFRGAGMPTLPRLFLREVFGARMHQARAG